MKKVKEDTKSFYIPSREEFHREYAGEISIYEFNTYDPVNRRKYPYPLTEVEQMKLYKTKGEIK